MRFKFPHFEDSYIDVEESQEAAYIAAGWTPVEEEQPKKTARKSRSKKTTNSDTPSGEENNSKEA